MFNSKKMQAWGFKGRVFALCLSAGLLSACSQAPVEDEENADAIPTAGEIPSGTVVVEPFPTGGDVVASPIPAPAPSTGGIASNPGFHIVQPGEGLYRIATQYGLNYKEVAQWNGIPAPYNLHPGQQLNLTPPSGGFVNTPVATTPVYTPPAVPAAPSMGAAQYHTVGRGETLYRISRTYGLGVSELANMNGLFPPYTLSVGQQLIVGNGGGMVAAPVAAVPASTVQYHMVQRGDTLYSISRRYGMGVSEVAAMNGLRPPYTLSVGQQLQVTGGSGGLSAASAMCPCR